MTRRLVSAAAALGALVAVAAPTAGAQVAPDVDRANATAAPGPATDRVIVQWAPRTRAADRAATRADADVTAERRLGDRDFQLVDLRPGQTAADAIAELEADPAVVAAARDGYDAPHAVPNDPLLDELWGLRNLGGPVGVLGFANPLAGADIDAPGAWIRTAGTPSTTVAILDSGYRFEHPDLAGVVWTNPDDPANGDDDDSNGLVDDTHGADFVGPNASSPTTDGDPTDDDLIDGGHGVHTAGTVGAAGGNGVGITGVAQDVRLMPLRVCSRTSSGVSCPQSSQIEAINYAGSHGARVANISLGGRTFNRLRANAFAANPGTLYVISAGNAAVDNDVDEHYPCSTDPTTDANPPNPNAVDNVICVAATDQADGLASFSNWGSTTVDLGAPGADVLSAVSASRIWSDDFEADDFASAWTGSGWGRTAEAPLTSFGINDSPGAAPAPSTLAEALSPPVAIPADVGGCRLHGRRHVSRGGGEFTYRVLSDGTDVYTSASIADTPGGMHSFQTQGIEDVQGTSLRVQLRYSGGSSPTASDGVWLDRLYISCVADVGQAVGYDYASGTSMAAPHVAGAAALAFSLDPGATVTEVRNALLASVDLVPSLAGKTVTGGRLDVSKTIDRFDVVAPAPPALAVSPVGPADDNTPTISGSAEERSTVAVHANGGCAGAPLATVGAGALAAGVAVTVADDSTTAFSATATDTAGNRSTCSGAVTYVERTTVTVPASPGPVAPAPAAPRSPARAICTVPKLKGKKLGAAKRRLRAASCGIGKVVKPKVGRAGRRKAKGRKGKKGKGKVKRARLVVRTTRPAAGQTRPAGTKVRIVMRKAPAAGKRGAKKRGAKRRGAKRPGSKRRGS